MTLNPAADAGKVVLQAVRELLTAFPKPGAPVQAPDGPLGPSLPTLSQVMQAPTGMTQYQSLAMLAATIRWVAHETSLTEEAVLDELGKNYSATPA